MKKRFTMLSGVMVVLMLLSLSVTAFAQVEQEPVSSSSVVELEAGSEAAEQDETEGENKATESSEEPEEQKDEAAQEAENLQQEQDVEPVIPEPEVAAPRPETQNNGLTIAPMLIRDNTPPVLQSISGTASTKLPGTFKLTLDIVEDGLGVSEIVMGIGAGIEASFQATWVNDGALLYTGKHTIELEATGWYDSVQPGEYGVTSLRLTDLAGNSTTYYRSTDEDGGLFVNYDIYGEKKSNTAKVTVTSVADAKTTLKSFELTQSKLTLPGTLVVDIDFTTETDGVQMVGLYLAPKDELYNYQYVYWYPSDGLAIESGKHTIEFDLNEYDFASGEYIVWQVYLGANYNFGSYGSASYYYTADTGTYTNSKTAETMAIQNNTLSITSNPQAPDDVTMPVVKGIKLLNKVVTSPGVLELELDIVEDGSGVEWISLTISYDMTDEMEGYKQLYVEFDEPLKTGKHVVQVPIDTMFVAGLEYRVRNFTVADRAGIYNDYYYRDSEDIYSNRHHSSGTGNEIKGFVKFTIADAEKGTVFSSLEHPALLDEIKNMADGATAYINYQSGGNTVAPAALFEAIAGTNKTLVFQGTTVQWVFAGANIKNDKIRDIDLTVAVYSDIMKKQFGEEEVVVVWFANEGDLPGAAEVRFANASLLERYGNGSSFYLTHFDDDNTQRETVEVKLGSDGVFGYTITHNSYFVLSSAKPLTEGVARESETGTGAGNNTTGNNNSGSGSSGSKKSAIAETGDSTNPYTYVTIALLAACVAGAAVWKKRRSV